MLALEDVHAGYGSGRVLHGLSFTVPAGSTTALVGRNGVGKTTALRAIAGQLRLERGSIAMGSVRLDRLRAHARARGGLAYVPQGREIFAELSVAENLRIAAYACGGRAALRRLPEIYEQLPVLGAKREAKGGDLSGGQQQILALARALVTEPTVLLLDEPTEGIQPSIVEEIATLIEDVRASRGLTILLVEQNLDFALRLADDVCVVDHGVVVERLRREELEVGVERLHAHLGV